MRPLELTFKGLRSYRDETHVDFTDVSLVAILGDTGAGKSSLLEAICLALYNSCSWSGSAAKPLLADGCPSMHVALRFSVGGREWTATRVINRNTTPAVHQLVSADGLERYDGETDVNRQIVRLIGLDHDAFLRAVVLPQGRFDTLLRATPAQRIPMLESILGIDQLEAVREEALAVRGRMSGPLEQLKVERAGLRPDPAGEARDAGAAAERAEALATQLAGVAERIAAEQSSAAKHKAKAGTLAGHQAEIAGIDPAGPADRLEQLAGTAAALDAARPQLADHAATTRSAATTLAGQVAAAEAAAVGPADMAGIVATLAGLTTQLPGLDAAEAANTQRAETLEREGEQLEQAERDAAAAEAATAAAKQAADEAGIESAAAHGALSSATTLIGAARTALAAEEEAAAAAVAAEGRLAEAAAAVERTAARLTAAGEAHSAADLAVAAARRADAAAAAAAGLHAGDDCPVCARTLPDGFDAPTPAGLAEAEKAAKDTLAALRSAEKAAAGAEALQTSRTEELARARTVAADAQRAAGKTAAAAEAAVGRFDPAATDDDLLAGLAEAARTAARAAADAHAEHLRVAGVEGQLAGAAATLRTNLTRNQSELDEAVRRTATTRAAMDATTRDLPDAFRPELPLSAETIAPTLQRAETEQAAVDLLAGQAVDAARMADDAAAALAEHDRRYANEVTGHVDEATLPLDRLCERLRMAAAALDQPGPDPRSAGATIAELASWADGLCSSATALAAACGAAAADASSAAATAEQAAADHLSATGFGTGQALNDALLAATADGRNHRRVQQEMEAQVPLAADYDRRLTVAGPLYEALEEVCALLAKSKFPKWVVGRRQHTLLAVASDTLAKMTGDRFRFTAEFQIYDHVSGQARDPRTLSGGETFLASLALALTLVEMAGRSGRRQESLFLDEGFASLDAECLDDALEVLSEQAGGGRLVAVITHLRQVAENLEHVLWVTKSLTGSTIKPLTIAERDALLSDDARSGLVA